MQVAKDSVVSIHYTLKDDSGQVLDSSDGRDPLDYIQGNYREAIRDLNAALEISPDYAPAYTNKAIAFLRLGDYPIARMNVDEALVLDRGNLTVLITAAEVYSASGEVEAACRLLEEAVDRGFEDFEVIRNRESFRGLFYSECFTRIHKRSSALSPDSPLSRDPQ